MLALSPAPRRHAARAPRCTSPLMLSDRMLGLAQDADRAGMTEAATALLTLACAILDAPHPPTKAAP